jgi:hypothetical protein
MQECGSFIAADGQVQILMVFTYQLKTSVPVTSRDPASRNEYYVISSAADSVPERKSVPKIIAAFGVRLHRWWFEGPTKSGNDF